MKTYSVILRYIEVDDYYCRTVEDESPEAAWRSVILRCVSDNRMEDFYQAVDDALTEFVEPVVMFKGDVFGDMIWIEGEFE